MCPRLISMIIGVYTHLIHMDKYWHISMYISVHSYIHVSTLSCSLALSSSFWTHAHANMPYFARAVWGRVDLVLVHSDMFRRICFQHIIFTGHSSGTDLLYDPLSVSHRFWKNWLYLYDTVLAIRHLTFIQPDWDRVIIHFEHWQFIEHYLGVPENVLLDITTVVAILGKKWVILIY